MWKAKIVEMRKNEEENINVRVSFSNGVKTVEDTIIGGLGFTPERLKELTRYKVQQLESAEELEKGINVGDEIDYGVKQEITDRVSFDRKMAELKLKNELMKEGVFSRGFFDLTALKEEIRQLYEKVFMV